MANNSGSRVLKAVEQIKGTLGAYPFPFAISDLGPGSGRKRVLTALILNEVEEITTILRMLEESRDRVRVLGKKMQEFQKQLPGGTVDRSTEIGRNYIEISELYFEETKRLTIHIKALHEWFYHLQKLIDGSREIRQLISSEHWSRLESYAEVRGALIAHKTKLEACVMGAIRFSGDYEKIELMLQPLNFPESVAGELDVLFRQCAPVLSKEEQQEANFYERCRILSAKQHLLKGDERARVVAFIRKYGTSLEDPSELAEFAVQLVADLIPKLSAAQVNGKEARKKKG